MERIIAIDPGTSYTGFLSYTGKVKLETLEVDKKLVSIGKLSAMVDKILSKIKQGDFIVMEDYGFGGRFFNVQVPELVGILKYKLYKLKKVKLMMIAPNTVKKLITGSGRATKAQVKKSVDLLSKENNVSFNTTHEADSYAIFSVFLKFYSGNLDEKTMKALTGRITEF